MYRFFSTLMTNIHSAIYIRYMELWRSHIHIHILAQTCLIKPVRSTRLATWLVKCKKPCSSEATDLGFNNCCCCCSGFHYRIAQMTFKPLYNNILRITTQSIPSSTTSILGFRVWFICGVNWLIIWYTCIDNFHIFNRFYMHQFLEFKRWIS